MKTITEQKPFPDVEEYIKQDEKIYIIGCGTCTAMVHTGGKEEVLQMKEQLEEIGKEVTGWMVIPSVCDDMTGDALKENAESVQEADSILVMSCAFGVQTVASYMDSLDWDKPVYPALDTLFVGKESGEVGVFSEICRQCGECVIAWTGGICPVAGCPKGLLNGPCGGTDEGMCEEDSERDCIWTLIYNRLEKLGQLDLMRKYQSPRSYQKSQRPGKVLVETERS